MAVNKDKNKTWSIELAPEDFCIDKRFEEYFVMSVNGPGEEPHKVDMWSYSGYFFEKIQKKRISEDHKFIDGILIVNFFKLFRENDLVLDVEKFVEEFTSYGFQQEMSEKYGVHVNIFALFGLCTYVKEIINRRYCLLFKPTKKDILDEIGNNAQIKSVVFKTSDNRECELTTEDSIAAIYDILKKEEDCLEYEFDHVVKAVDIFHKEYGQVEFVRYISRFFHDFFIDFYKIERRKNCYISSTEQRMLCFLLQYFGFANSVLQESRIRQFLTSKMDICESLMPLLIPNIFETPYYINIELIPYSIWKDGRINPLTYQPMSRKNGVKQMRFTMKMGSDLERIKEFVDTFTKLIKDCYT